MRSGRAEVNRLRYEFERMGQDGEKGCGIKLLLSTEGVL